MNIIYDVLPSTPVAVLKMAFNGYPEHMAVVNDDIEALDAALSAKGGRIDVMHRRDVVETWTTPLSLAIHLRRTRMVEHLIERGANVVDADTFSLGVAQHGNAACMAMLMRAGVDLTVSFNGETLCHDAAMNSDAAVLRMLVDAGLPCDNRSTSIGRRPIHEAAQNANEQVLMILLAAGCKCDAGVAFFAAGNENEKVLAMVIAVGTNVSVVFDAARKFPIHAAAANQNVAVVRALIAAGVDVNVVDPYGENPLFKACSNPNEQVLDALLAAGAE